ncbi:MAG TPA: hypothetical protein VH084_18530 [Mycobacterium sp.]|nr:hypothetical protein [Mycobacterium sp.]
MLPAEWASDVAATYLTLRLEAAQRHTGVRLIDPAFRGWCRLPGTSAATPGADRLSWLTLSTWKIGTSLQRSVSAPASKETVHGHGMSQEQFSK